MKRVLSFILALTMTLTLCACGSGSGKLSPYLMDFQFGAGEEATEKTILDLEKNDTFTAYYRLRIGIIFSLSYTHINTINNRSFGIISDFLSHKSL